MPMMIPAMAPPLSPDEEVSLPEAPEVLAEAGATMLIVDDELEVEGVEEEWVLLVAVVLMDVLVDMRDEVDVVVGIVDDEVVEEVVGTRG
jgi:hypothetical protein